MRIERRHAGLDPGEEIAELFVGDPGAQDLPAGTRASCSSPTATTRCLPTVR